MQEMFDQQLRQMLLVYIMLVMHGCEMRICDLDEACEDFLVSVSMPKEL